MSLHRGAGRLGPATLEGLRSTQPPPVVDAGARSRIRAANASAARHLVILDDDPTGSQVVHDVPVLTSWDDDDLRWAFGRSAGSFFILTNTRSLGSAATGALLIDLADRIARVAAELPTEVSLISRSDSTLRGHFPLETDVLARVAEDHGASYDAVLLVPAYLDAGRVTVGDVHYARVDDRYIPVGQTQYADDDAFGYRSSDLREWVREKVGDPNVALTAVSLDDIRTGGVEAVTARLLSAGQGAVVVVNALDESDLDVVVLALVAAEATGWRALCRVGPSFVPVRAGIERRAPLAAADIFPEGLPHGSGFVIVGSHMDLTTRQIERLLELDDLTAVELDVSRLVAPLEAAQELDRCAAELEAGATHGDIVLFTSRQRMVLQAGESSLDFARTVSEALVELTQRVVATVNLGWVVAKGGITSHDVATDGLRIRRATVLGQLFDGIVSVWRNESNGDHDLAGLPYVVFAGNVGDDVTLRDAVTILRGGTNA